MASYFNLYFEASAKLIFEHSQAELGHFMVDDLNIKDLKNIWKQFDHDEDGDIARGKLEPLVPSIIFPCHIFFE